MSEISQEKLLQIAAAAEKLVRCKGRYHSEQNYRALAALFGVTTPDLPPLESEVLQEGAAPDGWKLVPLEPTQEMIDAHVEGVQSGGMQKGYRAMIAAAPDFREISNSSTKHFRENAESSTNGWIPCSERLPEHGRDVQVFCSDTREQFVAYRCIGDDDFQYGFYEDVALVCNPTHWMPLPEAPGKEG